jgi:hypothetical protein
VICDTVGAAGLGVNVNMLADLAVWWMALLSGAVLVTTASKVAFIGWGIGCPHH